MASARQRKNIFYQLKDEFWVWRDKDSSIEELMVAYFYTLFTSEGHASGECLDHNGLLVSKDDNAMLTAPFTDLKIRDALFSMHLDKSPGHGMNLTFFQRYWHIVGNDV